MTETKITRHAMERLAQRGFRVADLDLILLIGTEVEDGYLVRTKDCQAMERALKLLLQRVQRLDGKRLVIDGDTVITGYHPGRKTERRLVRGAGDREMAA